MSKRKPSTSRPSTSRPSTFRPSSLRANLCRSVALGVFSWATHAYALPTGGTVTGTSGGTVTINPPSGATLTITSTAHRALIDWTNFSVSSGETVTFNEPDKNAIIVNRQLSGSSYIDGYITSLVGGTVGGNVWIINPNGIVFGAGAHLNVGGLLATTSNLVSDSAFLSGADTDPISFSASGAYASVVIAHGANITVNDGTAAFIAGRIHDYGSVTGAGSFQTDTKAVFATAQNFTIRFAANPPDPLRATDLDLFDLSATSGGTDLIMANGASTVAGQVILDNFADLTTLQPGYYSNTQVHGATIDATGNRGDGFDLMIMTGDIVNGAPVGGLSSDKTIVTIAPESSGNVSFPTSITSAGGLYVAGDEVLVNNLATGYATFNVAGHSDLIGHVAVDLTEIGSLDTDIAGGSVVISQQKSPLTLGTVTATSDVTIDGFDGVTIGSIAATGNVTLDTSGGTTVGNMSGAALYVGVYGDATFGDLSSTGGLIGIEESGRGNVTTGNINAAGAFDFSDTLYATTPGNVTTGAITAGQNIVVQNDAGSATLGALTTPAAIYLQSYGTLTIGGAQAVILDASAGYTGNGSGAVRADIDITGVVYVESAAFVASGTFRNTAPVTATANGYFAGYSPSGRIYIRANDVDIQSAISVIDVGNSSGAGRLYVESTNNLGMNIGDNLSNPTGFEMSGAEFALLKADQVTLEDFGHYGAGVRIGDLTIDAAKTPLVVVGEKYYGANATISVEGTMQGIGAPSFMIGGPYQEAQKPDNVIVSGAIGTAAHPMGYVYLGANTKVVLGSNAYLQEWLDDSNPGVFQPGLGGVANGHEWISAGNVVLATRYNYGGTIIEQNTSPTGEGLHITGSLTIEGQPYQVNLFGDLPDGKGGELYGQAAAASPELFVSDGYAQASWRFNGCQFGGGNCQPLVGSNSYGLPYGGSVTGTSGGNVTLTYNGPTLTVYSSAHRVIIDWQSFSIAAGDTVTFLEPDKNAIVVNRQLNGGASDIYGFITSLVNGSVGGNVWVINPNGVLFGAGSQVNVGGFLASTSNLTSDTTFLTEGDDAPITFAHYAGATGGLTLAAGSSFTVYDGTAAFIGDSILDNGSVTGAGAFATDTKAVFATAQDFTLSFASNPFDARRATDLDLSNLSATLGGGNLTLGPGSVTTAGQVIVDNFAYASGPGNYAQTYITGATVDATGHRGDGFDLMIMSGAIVNGAPVGGQYLDQTTVTIGSLGNTTPPTTLTSAGGLYISGDHVELNTHGGYMTTFDVAGQTLIHAIVQADLTNPGDLRTDITGGAVNIEENQGNLAVGNVTANSINIDANYGVTAGNLAAPTIGIDAGGDVRVGAVVAYGDGFGLYIHSLGNVTAGDIEARQATINAGQAAGDTISTGNVTAQSAVVFTAGGDIRTGAIDPATVTLDSTYGSVTAGDVTASDSITIDAGDKVTTGNLAAPTTTISAASDVQVGAVDATGDGSGLYVKTSGSVKTGDIDASSATIYAGDGAADTILVGNVTAAYTVVFTGGGDIRTGAINPASVTLESFYGAVDTGDITATYSIVIGAAGAVTTGNLEAPSATITAAGDVQIGTVDATGGGSGLYIHSYGSVKTGDIDASSATIHAGRYAGDTILVGNVTAEYAVILTAGGDIHTSAIDPTFVNIVSYYGSVATGDIASSGSVFVNAYSNITTGAVTAGYNINMNARVGTLETGALSAGSYVSLYSGGDMTIGGITSGGAFLRAGSFYSYSSAPADITITGAVSVNEATFIATGTFRNEAPITVTATETSNYGPSLYNASNGEVVIHAGDVDLQAPITAIDAGGTGRIIIEADNPDGVNIGDNLSSPSGFEMSNSEFGELKADQVYVLDFNRTADMRIGDLTIDAAKTPQVAFGAGHYSEAKYLTSQGQTISVEGTVSGVGNPTLIIGPNLPGHYGFKYYDYAPAHVIVSGAIGTASNPFGHVEISATYSIVIGSQTFAQEVGNGTAPSGWVEGLGGVEDGHEFISAGDVTLYSPGVIVGQDTSPRGDGMHITGSLTIEGDPTEVNLFGQLPGANGVILYGPIASTSPDLIVISYGGAAVGPYRFNGCLFGGADCQATIEVPITGFVPPLYAPTAGVYAGASPITITANGTGFGPGIDGVGSSFGPIVVAPSALPLGGDRDDGDRNDGEDGRRHRNGKNKGGKATVSGMGNEDHWPEGKH